MVVSVTLFPIPVQASILPWERDFGGLQSNFIPLVGLGEMVGSQPLEISMRQMAGNIAMFVPFGVLLPLLRRDVRFTHVLIAAALASIAIEASQFLISSVLGYSYKMTDVDDVLLNTHSEPLSVTGLYWANGRSSGWPPGGRCLCAEPKSGADHLSWL